MMPWKLIFLGWATEQCVPWVQGNVERDFGGRHSCAACKMNQAWASEAWITDGGWAQSNGYMYISCGKKKSSARFIKRSDISKFYEVNFNFY